MIEEPVIRQIQCPSCGAPIEWLDGETSMHCPYCNAGLERTLPRPEEKDVDPGSFNRPKIILQTHTVLSPLNKTKLATTAAAGAAITSGVVLTIFILVVVGILAAVFLFNPQSPITVNPPPLQVHEPFILVSNAAGEPSDVIAMSYDLKSSTYALGRLSLASKKFIWRDAPVDSISDVDAFVANGSSIFLVEKDTQLKALKLEDVSLIWQSELVDKLGYSDHSLAVQGDRVVALTQDYTLQAFDAVTGQVAWIRRLSGYTPGFTMLDKSLAVVDEVNEHTSLFILNLSDGSERKHFTPICESPDNPGWESEMHSSSGVFFAPGVDGTLDAGAVYFLYGSSPTCVERWDLADGELAWRSVDTDQPIPTSNDTLILVTPEMVYYGYNGQLWAVNQATTERKLQLENEDYDLLPMAMASDSLLVRARRTRGSERFELWSIDPITGANLWIYNLGESKPYQPPNEQGGSLSSGQSAWDWRISGEHLVLFKAATNPNQFIVESVKLSDGTVAQTFSAPIKSWSDDSYWMDRGLWQDSLYWAVVWTNLYVMDTDTGKIKYMYP
jgi:outer membrane protein assembly factor BamB